MKDRAIHLDRLELLFLLTIVFIYTAFFTNLSILKYLSFFSFNGNPLAEDNNMMWHTIRGKWFYQSIGERVFNSDVSLFYIIVAGAYKLSSHMNTIFVVRHLAIALGVVPIYLLSRKMFDSKLTAVFFSISFLLFNPLHHLSFVDDESLLIAFSLCFVLFAFYFFEQRQFGKFVLFCCLAIIAKEEDSIFMIPMFSVLAVINKAPLKWKAVPILLGLVYVMIDAFIILPLMNNLTGGYALKESMYVNTLFGNNPQGLPFYRIFLNNTTSIIERSLSLEKFIFNARILFTLFNPMIYISSLFAPEILLLGLPTLAVSQVSWYDYFLSLGLVHHLRYLIAFIFIASLFGVKRIITFIHSKYASAQWPSKQKIFSFTGILFLGLTLSSNFGSNILLPTIEKFKNDPIADEKFLSVTNMYDPVFYTQDKKDKSAWEFIRLIPEDASVSTTQYYLAALSGRDEIYHFASTNEINWTDGHDFEADFVFVNKQDDYPGFGGIEVEHYRTAESISQLLKSDDYDVVKETEHFILFKNKKYRGSDD